MIIGVAGPNGAGKGEVVRYLADRSFCALSLSDVIRDVLRERGIEESREEMIRAGRELRAEGGAGVLAEILAKQLQPERNYAIDSLRHPAEVEVLRASGVPFSLVWIDAEIETRFERMQRRGRQGDPTTVAELRELEARELGDAGDPAAQQLLAVRDKADHVVANDGNVDELHAEVQSVFERSQFFERPSWDEYFMSIARVVASRSNCVKRKVAAVVTRDRRIISTGYNGTPRGTQNCNEGGCPRCNSLAPEGTRLDECLCSHGEENAITQAAFHGVSLRGGTIYTTLSPCLQCTKLIINAGLAEVVYSSGSEYRLGTTSLALLREAGLTVRQI
jgi:dCMP deaminase